MKTVNISIMTEPNISKPFFYFTKENTFCISLKTRPDRWENMKKQFEYFSLDVTCWNASTPETLIGPFTHDAHFGHETQYIPIKKACAQSHVNIYKHIVKENLPYAFILEDDACFNYEWKKYFAQFTQDISKEKYEHFNLILFNTNGVYLPPFYWTEVTGGDYTGGYIISKKGAEWILNNFKDGYCVADYMTYQLQNNFPGYSYSFFPWLIIQDGKDSELGNRLQYNENVEKLACIQYDIKKYLLNDAN